MLCVVDLNKVDLKFSNTPKLILEKLPVRLKPVFKKYVSSCLSKFEKRELTCWVCPRYSSESAELCAMERDTVINEIINIKSAIFNQLISFYNTTII